jgi:hypothetical protein
MVVYSLIIKICLKTVQKAWLSSEIKKTPTKGGTEIFEIMKEA